MATEVDLEAAIARTLPRLLLATTRILRDPADAQDACLQAGQMCRTRMEECRTAVELTKVSTADASPDVPQELINAILAARDRDRL